MHPSKRHRNVGQTAQEGFLFNELVHETWLGCSVDIIFGNCVAARSRVCYRCESGYPYTKYRLQTGLLKKENPQGGIDAVAAVKLRGCRGSRLVSFSDESFPRGRQLASVLLSTTR